MVEKKSVESGDNLTKQQNVGLEDVLQQIQELHEQEGKKSPFAVAVFRQEKDGHFTKKAVFGMSSETLIGLLEELKLDVWTHAKRAQALAQMKPQIEDAVKSQADAIKNQVKNASQKSESKNDQK